MARGRWNLFGGADTLRAMSSVYRAPFGVDGDIPVDEAMLERMLGQALHAGGHYADLYFQYRVAGAISLEEGIVKSASRGVGMGLGVRVQKDDATGYAYTESFDPEAMADAARTASQVASGGGASPVKTPKSRPLPRRYVQEERSFAVPGEQKCALLRRLDRAARAYDPRIVRVQASLSEEWTEILIATSDGSLVRDQQPLLCLRAMAIAESGAHRQTGTVGGGGRVGLEYFVLPGHTPEAYGREAARVAVAMLEAKEAPAGEFPVVLSAGDSGVLLHEAVGHGLEADFNRRKSSNYSGRVGQPVASELVTVVDDPRYPHGRGSINVDDEGQEAVPVRLIEDGILAGYMHDRQSGRHFDVSSANGRRQSFRHVPLPRMTNTLLLGGPHTEEEIIQSVQYGILAKRFSGGQVDISNGDFVFSLTESYLIEDGKVTVPLKGVNLIGNGPEVLAKVDMLAADVQLSDGSWTCGKDGQSVPVGVGCPTMRISGMTVGGTKVGG